jgi:hypothetical protein
MLDRGTQATQVPRAREAARHYPVDEAAEARRARLGAVIDGPPRVEERPVTLRGMLVADDALVAETVASERGLVVTARCESRVALEVAGACVGLEGGLSVLVGSDEGWLGAAPGLVVRRVWCGEMVRVRGPLRPIKRGDRDDPAIWAFVAEGTHGTLEVAFDGVPRAFGRCRLALADATFEAERPVPRQVADVMLNRRRRRPDWT